VVTDLLEHFAEFAIPSFDEDHLVPRIVDGARGAALAARFAGPERLDLCGRGLNGAGGRCAFGDCDALTKAVESFFCGLAADFDEVGFFYARGSASELVGQFAIVGDEEKAFAEVVEAADRIKTLTRLGEEFHDGGSAFGIADGGDVTLGLVEHEVALALGAMDELAVDADVVAMGIGFAAEFGDNFAVDLDASLGDEFFGVTAARDTRLGEDFLEALEFGGRLRGGLLFPLGVFGLCSGKTVGGLLEGVACGGCFCLGSDDRVGRSYGAIFDDRGFGIRRRISCEGVIQGGLKFGAGRFGLIRILRIWNASRFFRHERISVLPAWFWQAGAI
jgi:hypothetical protein